MKKIKKTLAIGLFVSLAAQIHINFLTEGFIIALSVLVMEIFIYCYEDLSPRYVAFCSGIFSPLIRLLVEILDGGAMAASALQVIPDMTFFFTFGILYPLIYRYVVKAEKNIQNFAGVILACDFLSNMAELGIRSLLIGTNLLTIRTAAWMLAVAFIRTVLTQIILIAMEFHSDLLLQEEHGKEYRKLLTRASILESDLHVMDKNITEVEEIMKQAFHLYKSMDGTSASREQKHLALNISRTAHEIKGDYLNVIRVLKETFEKDVDERSLFMSEILSIEKMNLQSTIRERGFGAEITLRLWADFPVRAYFQMMSIVRNLMLNAAEAIGKEKGKITVNLKRISETKTGDQGHLLTVRDTGPGISPEHLEAVFYEGFSTKFNEETGDIQRGIGLSVIKDYVESLFGGTIEVHSEVGVFTEFAVFFPERYAAAAAEKG